MTNLAFKMEERTKNEKAKVIRKKGEIPGIIYGGSLSNPISIKMKKTQLPKIFASHLKSSIIPLSVNDSVKNCVIKDVQKDNFGKVIHVDFQCVKANEKIKLKVPVSFEGQGALTSKGLLLEIMATEIEVQGSVEKIPETILIDVSKMNYEDKVLAENINLPEDVHLVTHKDLLLAVIASAPTEEVNEEETSESDSSTSIE
ncbi:MAG: 50S ribosomal protein L25 [Clostridiales bacterium]|nr:50S ribosomal protein L25 [Clostridiales bacterium]